MWSLLLHVKFLKQLTDTFCIIFHSKILYFYYFILSVRTINQTLSPKNLQQTKKTRRNSKREEEAETKGQRTQHESSTGTNPRDRSFRHEPRERRWWRGWNDSILDLIFIQGIPRRQEFRAIKHSLSFDEPDLVVRNAKGEPITADYAVVRLTRSHTPVAHFKRDFLLADSEDPGFLPSPLPCVRIIPV